MSANIARRSRILSAAVSLSIVVTAPAIAASPVFEAAGYGVPRPVQAGGYASAIAARLADTGGPAELDAVGFRTPTVLERWHVDAAGIALRDQDFALTYPLSAILWADVDSDGDSDLITSGRSASGLVIEVHAMTAAGLSQTARVLPVNLSFPWTEGPRVLTLTDLDGNGSPDLTLGGYDHGSERFVTMADFLSATPVIREPFLQGWTQLVDLDGDGLREAVSFSPGSLFLTINRDLGGGGFELSSEYLPADGVPIVADLRGDARPEIVAGRYLYALGESGAVELVDSLEFRVEALRDLDHDGRLDAIVVEPGAIQVANGRADGTFAVPRRVTWGSAVLDQSTLDYAVPSGALVVADLDGDGWDEIATPGALGDGWSILKGRVGGGFHQPLELPTGAYPTQVRLVDLDGDGKLDLVDLARDAARLEWRQGNGDGSFGQLHSASLPANPRCFTLGDLDGDGRLDAVVGGLTSAGLSVLRGVPGGFGARTDFPVKDSVTSVAVGDLDEDGHLDLLTLERHHEPTLRLGIGGLAFAPAAILNLPATVETDLRLMDLNGDSHLDIVSASGSYNTQVEILEGDGRLGFLGTWSALLSVFYGRVPFTIADVLGSGKPAIVYAGRSNLGGLLGWDWYSHVFMQSLDLPIEGFPRPPGDLDPEWYGYEALNDSRQVEVSDVTGDGIPDMLVLSGYNGELGVFRGQGGGFFDPEVAHVVGADATSFALGDVDGDGRPDALVASGEANSVMVLRNATALTLGVDHGRPAVRTAMLRALSTRDARFEVTLPASGRATLELFDIAGRVITRQSWAPGRSGTEVISLSPGSLGSGLYWARLTQAGHAVTARWIHMH